MQETPTPAVTPEPTPEVITPTATPSVTEQPTVTPVVNPEDDGYIYLTITADSEWLKEAEYPVCIDPILTKKLNGKLTDSGSICSNAGSVSTDLKAGNDKGNIWRAYLKFDLPSIPLNSVISSAELNMGGTPSKSNDHYLIVRETFKDWTCNGNDKLSWNSQPVISEDTPEGEELSHILDYAVNGGYFDITKTVRKWHNGQSQNKGLMICAYDEGVKKIDTIYTPSKNKPFLKIIYRNYIGIEDYWRTHMTSAGTAGVGYINDNTGSLTAITSGIHTNGNRMPFDLKHVYNSNESGEKWRLNYDQRIYVPTDELDITEYPYVFIDEDGTRHYFKSQEVKYLENGTTKTASKTGTYPAAADEDGLKLFIVPVTDKTLKNDYPLKLIDKSSSLVRYFDKSGKLAMISDSNRYENGSNKDKKEANSIRLNNEKYGEEYSTAKYDETLIVLKDIKAFYDSKDRSDTRKKKNAEDIKRADSLILSLCSDINAKTDYQTAKALIAAKTAFESGQTATTESVQKTKFSDAYTKFSDAKAKAEAIDLYRERLISLTDAVGNTSNITYDSSSRITAISDPAKGGNNTYSYDGQGRLTGITYSDGRTAGYTYDDNQNMTGMRDHSGYLVSYTYENDHIVRVAESKGSEKGQTYEINYGDNYTNTFRFSGQDDIYGNEDDIVNTHVFDERGRTISVYSKQFDQNEVLGAQALTYDDNAATSTSKTAYSESNNATNLVDNYSFEDTTDDWKKDSLYSTGVDLKSNDEYLGAYAAKIKPDGGIGAFYQSFSLPAGTYTLSFRMKRVGGENAGVMVYEGSSIGSYDTVYYKTDYSAISDSEDWLLVYGTFKLTGRKTIRVSPWAEGSVTAYFDCIVLVEGDTTAYGLESKTSASASQSEKKDNDPNTRNKIKDYAVTGRQTQNLLKNHGFEYNDQSWTPYVFNGSAANGLVNIYASGQPYIGAKSTVFNMKNIKKTGAGAKQTVRGLKPGRYTLSGYVNTKDLENTSAYIKVTYDGKVITSEKIDYITPDTIDKGWERLKVTFELIKETDVVVSMEADCKDQTGKGTVSFDCIQLEKGEVANQYNILEDGGFEMTDSETPYQWKCLKKVKVADEVINTGAIEGNNCYHITGEPGKDKYLTFTTHLGSEQNSFVLSGWIRSKTTPVRENRELKVKAYHKDDEAVYESALNLDDFSEGWKYFTLIMPAHKWSTTTISIHFFDNIGDLYIDGMQLSINEVSTNSYDSNGRIKARSVSEKQTSYEYDTYGRNSKTVSSLGMTQSYSYDASNKNTKITSDIGPNSYMTYDKYGNLVSLQVHTEPDKDENGNATNKPLELYSQNTYTDNGNYLKSTTGNNGAVTNYVYDQSRGLLSSETLPSFEGEQGVKITYGYDSLERINRVTRSKGSESRSVSYTYGAFSDLSKITHNGFDYEYTYDNFGNIISTKVAGVTTQTNVYNPNNGSLKYTTYGSENIKQYTEYDEYGNVSAIKAERNGNVYTTDTYKYYNDGNVAEHKDPVSKITTEYDYNEAGRVIRTRIKKDDDSSYNSKLHYTYNVAGQVAEIKYDMGSGIKSYKYVYAKDGKPTKSTFPSGAFKTNTYDPLRRNSKTVFAPKSNSADAYKLTTNIKYARGEAKTTAFTGTQNHASWYENKIGSKIVSGYSYTYDANGNITSITESLTAPKANEAYMGYGDVSYSYNAFGEIEKAIIPHKEDPQKLKEIIYKYDNGGNIVSETTVEKVFSPKNHTMQYNPGVLYDLNEFYDEVSKTSVEYQYDPVWKDKLIKYNGKTITYDGNGNPTNYMGIPMSWDVIHGTLTSVKKNNTNIRYGYTSDGQRLTKEVAGKKTTYVYNAGMLLSEVTDTDRINYYYDSDGIITQVGYQKKSGNSFGTEIFYFFTRNGQGDVVGVYEGNKSTLVGTYEYDLWGKVAAVTKASSTSDPENFLNRNPIRYRGYYYDNETGFYYLNARYYDPIVHRFISADVRIAGVSKDVTGYNLYEYCNNNPVMFVDYTGYWPTKKESGLTFSLGLDLAAVFWFWQVGFNPAVTIDTDLNMALQYTNSAGVTASNCLAGCAGINATITNTPDLYKLEGEGGALGFSLMLLPGLGAGLYGGGDFNVIPSAQRNYFGLSFTEGVTIATSIGAEAHTLVTRTHTYKSFNIAEQADKIWKGLKEYFINYKYIFNKER